MADALPDKITSLVYLDAFVPGNGQSLLSLLPPGLPAPVAASEYTLAPLPAAFFGASPEVAAFVDARTEPQPTACFTQALKLSGGIDRIKKKTYIYANVPAPTTFTPFYENSQEQAGLDCAHAALHTHRSDRLAQRADRSAAARCVVRPWPRTSSVGSPGLAHRGRRRWG